MNEKIDINVNIGLEMTLPGKVLFKFMETLVGKMGIQGLQAFLDNDVYMCKKSEDSQEVAFMLMPSCDCESCSYIKENLKNQLRKGENTSVDIDQIIEILKHFKD
jgi:ketopantoate reductase